MNIKDFIVSEDNTIIEVMKIIDSNSKGIVFVCEEDQLLAVVTDGNIRRFILKNGDLNEPIKVIANYNPIYVNNSKNTDCVEYMKKKGITALPVLNKKKKIISIRFLNDNNIVSEKKLDVPVVIMAGGKGTRLYPYTQILPKPLIPVGEKTITELIMDHFESFGCKHFDMIVNYKKNLIRSFFLDNEQKRDVDFIEEAEFLGTGGGLKLLGKRYKDTFFVTNCDVLIEEDYASIIDYHKKEKNIITIISAMKEVTIPYGTIELNELGQVAKLNEKPNFTFLTNTGLYVLEPEFLDKIPDNTFIHITDIIEKCINDGEKVGIYPIAEQSWMDMGQLEELEKMRERIKVDTKI